MRARMGHLAGTAAGWACNESQRARRQAGLATRASGHGGRLGSVRRDLRDGVLCARLEEGRWL
jgi:hypothetical protein